MAALACPVCGENENERSRIPDKPRSFIDCPRCGRLELSDMFEVDLRNPTALQGKRELLPYLSAYIRQVGKRGTPPPFISSENWEELATSRSSTPLHEKTIRLLSLLAGRARPGNFAAIEDARDAPLLDCFDANEVGYLINYLVEAKLIEDRPARMGGSGAYMLTIPGWERLAPTSAGMPGRGFVAMSYKPALFDAWALGIQPAIEIDCRPASAIRVDRTEHNEKICDKILIEIRLAEFLVADVTLQSPGVYFEAGFAMALARPVIWTCREDDFKNAHFDTRQYNHIVWEDADHLRQQLATRIKGTIPSAIDQLGRRRP